MIDRTCRCLILLSTLGALGGAAVAEEGRLAVTGKFGNIGPGLDLTYGLTSVLHTRLAVQYAPKEELGNDDIKYAGSLLLDWHPGGGSFRLSGGLGILRERLGGYRTLSGFSVPSHESTGYASYFGIGWGNALRRDSRWNFSIDLGGFGGGGFSYSTSAVGSSSGAPVTALTQSLQAGRVRLDTPTWRPVFSTGISYRF